ncbi:MAG: pyridoxamine 5'-phosphate oxidase [Pseudomonadota bacterium]
MRDIREEYKAEVLRAGDMHSNPLAQAQRWVDEAIETDLPLPNAMTLATVDADGQPSSRVVLLKGIDQKGLTFFTDYESDKGRDMAANPKVSVTFFWQPFDRQLIVKGRVEKLSEEESTDYFHSRPYASQISAAISPQSDVVSREWLEAEVERLQGEYPQAPVPRPERWGGYRIVPVEFQFWHGRPNRLHDRLRYTPRGDDWLIERLAP